MAKGEKPSNRDDEFAEQLRQRLLKEEKDREDARKREKEQTEEDQRRRED